MRVLAILSFIVFVTLATVASLAMLDRRADEAAQRDEPISRTYFPTAERMVADVSRLLKAQAWGELAGFYDLDRGDVPKTALASGAWFQGVGPGGSGPVEFARYRPFPPGAEFQRLDPMVPPDVFRVVVRWTDPASGGVAEYAVPVRRTPEGYRLLTE